MKRWSSRWIDLSGYKGKDILLSVVGQRIPSLVPSNKAKTFYKCLCPFHYERTASMKFFYNRQMQGWWFKCFGCGRSGDVFDFLMRYERWEFWDAMLYIIKGHTPSLQMTGTPSKWIQLKIPFPEVQTKEDPLPFK